MSNRFELRLRTEVTAVTLLLNHEGLLDYSGHVSARLPGDDLFLVQSFDDSRAALAPDRLLVVDLDGHVIDGPRGARAPAEVHIHCAVFRARPDVRAILHNHPETATVFTLVEDVPLALVKNHAARWASGIPIHPDPGHINTPARGQALAATLGAHQAALIRAHGAVLVAENTASLFVDAVHFEENARAAYAAAQLGRVKPLAPDEVAAFAGRFDRARHVRKLWQYYVGRGIEAGVIPPSWDLDIEGAGTTID